MDWGVSIRGTPRLTDRARTSCRITAGSITSEAAPSTDRGRQTGCRAAAGILEREGKAPETETGVRVTVLGAPGTRIYVGEGPLVDAPPHHRLDGHPEPSCPLVLVRRKAKSATYAAVHEPYSERPSVRSVSLLQESAEGIGMKVEAEGYSDRLLVGFGSSPGRQFSFARRRGKRFGSPDTDLCEERAKRRSAGKVRGVPRPAWEGTKVSLTLNGKKEPPTVRDGFLVYGDMPRKGGELPSPMPQNRRRQGQRCIPIFLPEEVRLKAGAEREVGLTLRAVGRGEVAGALQFIAPEGISVDPAEDRTDTAARSGREPHGPAEDQGPCRARQWCFSRSARSLWARLRQPAKSSLFRSASCSRRTGACLGWPSGWRGRRVIR